MELPSYQSAISSSFDNDGHNQGYRLYIQYNKSKVCCFDKFSLEVQAGDDFQLNTYSYPSNSFIVPSSRSIKSVVGNSKETFTIVIEGEDKAKLKAFAKIYTSRKYVSYPNSETLKQAYEHQTVSQFIRGSKRSLEILVSNVDSFEIGLFHYLKFHKSSKSKANYALLVSIKKSAVMGYRIGTNPNEFVFDVNRLPTMSKIVRVSGSSESPNTLNMPEPAVEFEFRGNDLPLLKYLQHIFMHQLNRCSSYHFRETSLKNVNVNSVPNKVIFNLARWDFKEAKPIWFQRRPNNKRK